MELQLEGQSARRWADFSGDFNPIHFHADLARKAGLKGAIVHGMLALLHVKQAAASELDHAGCVGGWKQFKALFREPLLRGRDARIELRRRQDAVSFRLISEGISHFSGTHSSTSSPGFPGSEIAHSALIEGATVRKQEDAFRDSFPFVRAPWVFLDSIAFAEILRIGLDLAPIQSAAHAARNAGQITKQMSHRVVFDPARTIAMLDGIRSGIPLRYAIRRVEYASQPGARLSLVELNFMEGGSISMQVELGLISKDVLY